MAPLRILEEAKETKKGGSYSLAYDNGLTNYLHKLSNKIKNNKILFINTPQIIFSRFNLERALNQGYQVYPPLGLQCLSAAIANRDIDVKILDMNFEFLKGVIEGYLNQNNWMSFLEKKIEEADASVIGVSSIFDVFQPNFMKILKYLKKRESVVIAGGPSATYRAEKLVGMNLADLVCKGESEGQIQIITDKLYGNENSLAIPGIIFKKEGSIKTTGEEKDYLTYKLNIIPQYKKLPLGEYYKYGTLGPMQTMAGREIPFATVQVARGCRYNCDFCCVNELSGRGLRMKSLEDTLSEIEFLYKNYGKIVDGYKSLYIEFIDDDLGGIGNERLTRLCLGIQNIPSQSGNEPGKILYGIQNGLVAVHLDEIVLKTMNETGCIGWKVGIESGNNEILRAMRKPGNLSGFEKFAERKKKFAPNTIVGFNYILGTIIKNTAHLKINEPVKETFGQMLDSYRFAKKYNTDWGSFSIFQDSKTDKIIEDEDLSFERTASGGSKQKSVRKGTDIFNIPYNAIPSQEQLKDIWRTFDFLVNYVFNPRLRDRQEKMFIKYTSSIRENYPTEVGVPFYLALVHKSIGEDYEADKNLLDAKDLYNRGYGELIDLFELKPILENFPKTKENAGKILNDLKEKYDGYGKK